MGNCSDQLANAEEFKDGASTGGVLGEILIRCNNVLYIRGIDEEGTDEKEQNEGEVEVEA
ncbi:hypothetical protein IWQ62_001042 [Dispira parvispora]|uniref:Uncharacterized protein n=1 Tax=Dispira parvispora TaxID=1520584 RepID=A0A9W8AT77_9FUNG|nr:hypothetical protein IWQ62_001042 [Dispira parvispora]